MIDSLVTIDLTRELDALPRHPAAKPLPRRGAETHITLHYSGVDGKRYANRTRGAEIARILDEARYQLAHNYGTTAHPVYPDGYLYDLVVLSTGDVVRTRRHRQQLMHAGNTIANQRSWSVHVVLGTGQDLTDPQRASLFRVFDALRAARGRPRAAVVGHNEWPRFDGLPQPRATYGLLPKQSACPGPVLHRHLATYRALPDADGPAYTAESRILGPSRVTVAQALADTMARPCGYPPRDVALILDSYAHWCGVFWVDLGVAWSQVGHETGNLTSWWSQRPRRNPAGLGVTGDTDPLASYDAARHPADRWARDEAQGLVREGLSFAAWRPEDCGPGQSAIIAHLGRLLAYALPEGAGSPAQREAIATALARRPLPAEKRGQAETLAGLAGTWAVPGWKIVGGRRITYADKLAERAERMRRHPR